MSAGFFALLDDIAAIAKVAASSLDDVAAQTVKAGKTTAGIVIDDAAVTPRYVTGFAAERELPIIAKIAVGSLRNKLLYLLPAALLLTAFMPWAITPLLVAGGAYLCFEGYEKVLELRQASADADPDAAAKAAIASPMPTGGETEDAKVASAIRTDFILSAEIMAITLAGLQTPSFWVQAATLALVGTLVTVAVYGAVALIVKADDVGLHLAQTAGSDAVRAFGHGLVHSMPKLLVRLGLIGMAAMLWVGGGIFLHALEGYGLGAVPHAIHGVARLVGGLFGPLSGAVAWLIDATAAGIIGLGIGWLVAKGMAAAGLEAP
jgi:predicted DNA repair protein MutK